MRVRAGARSAVKFRAGGGRRRRRGGDSARRAGARQAPAGCGGRTGGVGTEPGGGARAGLAAAASLGRSSRRRPDSAPGARGRMTELQSALLLRRQLAGSRAEGGGAGPGRGGRARGGWGRGAEGSRAWGEGQRGGGGAGRGSPPRGGGDWAARAPRGLCSGLDRLLPSAGPVPSLCPRPPGPGSARPGRGASMRGRTKPRLRVAPARSERDPGGAPSAALRPRPAALRPEPSGGPRGCEGVRRGSSPPPSSQPGGGGPGSGPRVSGACVEGRARWGHLQGAVARKVARHSPRGARLLSASKITPLRSCLSPKSGPSHCSWWLWE